MIQANELRIGNMVNRELHSPRGLEYDPHFILDENAMGALFNQDKNIALQDLFPIPLTPEILEKAGFEQSIIWGYEHPFLKCRYVINKAIT
mgnify:CR=1 FL=1